MNALGDMLNGPVSFGSFVQDYAQEQETYEMTKEDDFECFADSSLKDSIEFPDLEF